MQRRPRRAGRPRRASLASLSLQADLDLVLRPPRCILPERQDAA